MKTILVVDDSRTIRTAVKNAIRDNVNVDITFTEASNSKEAIHSLSQARVDVIITDLEMDGGDGNSLILKLSNNPLLKKKVIIVFSSTRPTIEIPDNVICVKKPDTATLCKILNNLFGVNNG